MRYRNLCKRREFQHKLRAAGDGHSKSGLFIPVLVKSQVVELLLERSNLVNGVLVPNRSSHRLEANVSLGVEQLVGPFRLVIFVLAAFGIS